MTNAYGSTSQDPALRAAADKFEEFEQAAGDLEADAKRGAKKTKKAAVAATGALAEAATTLARDARTLVGEKASKAKVVAEEQYGRLKEQAKVRADEADVFVHERPYAALAVAAFAGFLIGHFLSTSRSNVIYLRDDR